MDWSFIVLLFAASLFLASMTALIIVVYKVFMKPPPANHFANAPPPQICGWNPHPEQTQDMPPIQRSEPERRFPPAFYDRPVTGLVPFGMTAVPMESPVFSPEPPVHRAVRVTPTAPVPDSAPAAGSVWPTQNMQREVSVLILKAGTKPDLVFRPELPQKKPQTGQASEPKHEPAAGLPKQTPAAVYKAVPAQSPEPLCETVPDISPSETSDPDTPSGPASANLQAKSSRPKKRSGKKQKERTPQKRSRKGSLKRPDKEIRNRLHPAKLSRRNLRIQEMGIQPQIKMKRRSRRLSGQTQRFPGFPNRFSASPCRGFAVSWRLYACCPQLFLFFLQVRQGNRGMNR